MAVYQLTTDALSSANPDLTHFIHLVLISLPARRVLSNGRRLVPEEDVK